MNYNAVIIDDEKNIAFNLELMINEFCDDINIIGIANGFNEGIELINRTKPNIVFLDINMPYGSGFDVIEKTNFKNFHVIFITAHDDYAIKAFKTNAIAYLLKPIDIEDLVKAINKAKEIIDIKLNVDILKKIVLSNNSHNDSSTKRKLILPVNDGLEFYDPNDIIMIKAEGSYSVINLISGNKVTVSKNSSELEDLLDNTKFFRTHKSFIINLDHIKKYNKTEGGSVQMTDGSFADLSRRKKDEFVALMMNNGEFKDSF